MNYLWRVSVCYTERLDGKNFEILQQNFYFLIKPVKLIKIKLYCNIQQVTFYNRFYIPKSYLIWIIIRKTWNKRKPMWLFALNQFWIVQIWNGSICTILACDKMNKIRNNPKRYSLRSEQSNNKHKWGGVILENLVKQNVSR